MGLAGNHNPGRRGFIVAPGVRMDAVSSLFATIGYIVVGAGAVGTFVWWLFRTFSEKWLNAKFEERLAAYKHEQHLRSRSDPEMPLSGRGFATPQLVRVAKRPASTARWERTQSKQIIGGITWMSARFGRSSTTRAQTRLTTKIS